MDIKRSELRDFFAPHVGAQLAATAYDALPNRTRLDVTCKECHTMHDIDVREVDETGLVRFFYSGSERVEFADITSIRVRNGADDRSGAIMAVVDSEEIAA